MINLRIHSPNYSKNVRKAHKVKYLILHYTGMQSKRASIGRLKSSRHKVSCHYLIDRNGTLIQMVDENKIAWHAGKSKWKNIINLNEVSLGIELVNRGHELGYEKYTNKQINKLIKLCRHLKKKYKIKISSILGHSDIAPLRKIDPGEKFPWIKLSQKKLIIWPKKLKKIRYYDLKKKKIRELFFKNLHKIGYRYFDKKINSKKDLQVIKAFKMRYLPKEINGAIDQKTLSISHYLAKRI